MLLLIIRIAYLVIAAGAIATYTLNQGEGTPDVIQENVTIWNRITKQCDGMPC